MRRAFHNNMLDIAALGVIPFPRGIGGNDKRVSFRAGPRHGIRVLSMDYMFQPSPIETQCP